jgi:hypothetical protein
MTGNTEMHQKKFEVRDGRGSLVTPTPGGAYAVVAVELAVWHAKDCVQGAPRKGACDLGCARLMFGRAPHVPTYSCTWRVVRRGEPDRPDKRIAGTRHASWSRILRIAATWPPSTETLPCGGRAPIGDPLALDLASLRLNRRRAPAARLRSSRATAGLTTESAAGPPNFHDCGRLLGVR